MIIGYTAGAFDLFHIGHLNLLKKAKNNCDYLIVGVTTDDLILRTKNKKPVIPYEERCAILTELRCVDKVVMQDDLDKVKAWEKYNYDILFSGDDWQNSPRWKRYVENLNNKNVKVIFFPYTKTTSSTLITKVLQDSLNV